MNHFLTIASVITPQPNYWTHGDIINAAIAVAAIATLVGSVGMNRRQYRFAIKQINREEIKKLYVPMLAMMRAEWSKFDAKMLTTILPSSNMRFLETEDNLALLRAKIQSYEFEVEEDLLGSQALREAINDWFKRFVECTKAFEKFQGENLRASLLDTNAGSEFRYARDALLNDLRTRTSELEAGLENLKDLIREEVGLASSGVWKKFQHYNGGQKRNRTMEKG